MLPKMMQLIPLPMAQPQASRRQFLLGALAVGGGLAVGFNVVTAAPALASETAGDGQHSFSPYVVIDGEGKVTIVLGVNHIRVEFTGVRLTSKLIDGRFPDYERVIPNKAANVIKADRELLRQALQRTGILSNEKYRGVRLELEAGKATLSANNPDQEEATESLELEYAGQGMEIGFNVNYLLEALNAVGGEQVELHITDANSSCLIVSPGSEDVKYVVMPMRL